MSTIAKIMLAGLAALLLCAGEGALFAADTAAAEPQNSVVVPFSDLNLQRPADVATLYHRIARAAASACGARDLTVSELAPPDYRPCIGAAIARAVAQVDSRALSAYHKRQLALERDPTVVRR